MLELSSDVNKYLERFGLPGYLKENVNRNLSGLRLFLMWLTWRIRTVLSQGKMYIKIAIVCRCRNRLSRPANKN